MKIPEIAVYVTSSSAIVLGTGEESNVYDTAYDPCYYNASQLSSCSANTTYESARIRSIFYEPVNNTESQEITCFLEDDKGKWYFLFFKFI